MVVVIRRVSLVLVLVLVLCTLVPFAYASPPDQTWRPGIYDDADFDDVVTFLADEVADGDLVVTMGCGDVWMLGDAVIERIEELDAS